MQVGNFMSLAKILIFQNTTLFLTQVVISGSVITYGRKA